MKNKRIIISIILLIVLCCLIINNKERFIEPDEMLLPPVILKAEKKKTDAFIEWYNDDKKITSFIVLYIDIDTVDNGIWIQRQINCNKKKCKLVINDLLGTRYKVAVLSSHKDRVSDISNIATFSDEESYTNIAVSTAPALDAEGEDSDLIYHLDINDNKNPASSDQENNINNSIDDKKDDLTPSQSGEPIIICDDGLGLKQKNIKNEEDLENAKVKNKCNDDIDFEELGKFSRKTPFYHYYWDKIF